MNGRGTRAAIALAITAAMVRLVPLQWLHPLNWDELEYYRVTRWIAEGRIPFRDFWEHHTPLSWFLFAPFTLLSDSPGVAAIVLMRWVQVPVWIAVFWLVNRWMTNAGLSRFARWAAMALVLSSSMLMLSAVEFRLDPLGIAFYFAGLVLWQRQTPRAMFAAGVMFGLCGWTNMRFAPLLVLTVLLLCVVRERRWKLDLRAGWLAAGGLVAVVLGIGYFVATHSLQPFLHSVFTQNYIGDKYGPHYGPVFLHRLLVPFGIRIMSTDRFFEWAAVDVGGVALTILGLIGLVLALGRWRAPDDLFLLAIMQLGSAFVISRMNYVYNYHLQIVVIAMIPFIALVIERIPRRGLVFALLAVAWCVSSFAAVFRGKELDLAYQDFVMREADARTLPNERVFGGNAWALRREPAYFFWFLPDMTGRLVQRHYSPGYQLDDIVRNPPALVTVDQTTVHWLTNVQPELREFFARHYLPVWRNVMIPAMNARLAPGRSIEWSVPRDGTYRLFAYPFIATHPWFQQPLRVAAYDGKDAARLTMRLPEPAAHPELQWSIDGNAVDVGARIALHQGQRIRVTHHGAQTTGVILLAGDDTMLFRQPEAGASLEPGSTRVTHIPSLGARIAR